MAEVSEPATGVSVVQERWRRVLLTLGCVVTVFGVMHHVDHVVRSNHSGWPFREEVMPFTFSLLIYALLLPGIYMNLRGRVAAGWCCSSGWSGSCWSSLFISWGVGRKAPIRDIYAVYHNPVWGVLALVVLYGLVFGLAALVAAAFRAVLARRTRSFEGGGR